MPQFPFVSRNNSISRRGGILQGCLIAAAIVIAVIVGIGIFVAYNWRGWVASGVRETTTAVLADTSLVQEDKDRISARVETLAKDFESGKLTLEQVGKIVESLVASPVLPAAIVSAAEKQYFPKAEFTADEASAGQRALQRCARGVSEGKITEEKIREILTPIAEVANADQIRLKPVQDVSKDDVRKFVANALSAADGASIPDEAFNVDYAKEICDLIDRAVAESPSKVP